MPFTFQEMSFTGENYAPDVARGHELLLSEPKFPKLPARLRFRCEKQLFGSDIATVIHPESILGRSIVEHFHEER
jgi:hypothetical protein